MVARISRELRAVLKEISEEKLRALLEMEVKTTPDVHLASLHLSTQPQTLVRLVSVVRLVSEGDTLLQLLICNLVYR